MGRGRDAEGPCGSPETVLNFFPQDSHLGDFTSDEPGRWFSLKCAEAGCIWFVPLVVRMATGEAVALDEIKAVYRANNNGKELEQVSIQELI